MRQNYSKGGSPKFKNKNKDTVFVDALSILRVLCAVFTSSLRSSVEISKERMIFKLTLLLVIIRDYYNAR